MRKKLSLVHIFRAVAVIFILIGHANKVFNIYLNYDWFNMSQWERTGGIDFFFLVSGFMLYYLYHKDIGVPGKAKVFLVKRIVKIYPIYWLFTLAILFLILLFPQLGDGHEKNWQVILKSFLLFPTDPILATSWSLSYVILFYVVFSLLIYRPKTIKPIIACWIIVILLAQFNIIFNPDVFIFSFSNLEIMFGVCIALIVMNHKVKYSSLLVVTGILGYLFIWSNNVNNFYNLREDYFYCLFSILIMLGITSIDLKKEIQLPKSLSTLGDSSYSIFISQLPILHFYMLILGKFNIFSVLGNFVSMCLVIILTVLTGCMVYYLIEKPVATFFKHRISHYPTTSIIKPLAVK